MGTQVSTSYPNILVTSQGHLTLRLMTCNEWKKTQRQDILLIICIFQLSDLQEQIFGLSLRQRLRCVTYFLCFFSFFKGHITITNYLLNYFPGLDIEKRNAFGFTALMKSAMQGRTECVKALMMAGMKSAFLFLCHHLTTTKKLLLGCLLWEWWYSLPWECVQL